MSEFVNVRTADLTGAALDWAVANGEEIELSLVGAHPHVIVDGQLMGAYRPSTDWSQAGPLIEACELTVEPSAWDWRGVCVLWRAQEEGEDTYFEHTNLLVAAMRAVAYAKLGETVSVPKELLS